MQSIEASTIDASSSARQSQIRQGFGRRASDEVHVLAAVNRRLIQRLYFLSAGLLVMQVAMLLVFIFVTAAQTGTINSVTLGNRAVGVSNHITACNNERLLFLRVIEVGGQTPQTAGKDSCGVPLVVWPVVYGR